MASTEITSLRWEGIPALELRAADKRALVLPGFGGHLLRLEDPRGPRLRCPGSLAEYLALPEAYGLPVLFPPNRFTEDRFSAGGREYRLPPNRPGNRYIHGFLFDRPWQVEQLFTEKGAAGLEMTFNAGERGELFQWFPHPFQARLIYRLNGEGLSQEISFENRGNSPMPFMLGFHTAFALPGRDREPESFRITIPLGDELEVMGSRRSAPGPEMAAFRTGKILRQGEAISGQFLASPPENESRVHEVLIENPGTGASLRYLTAGAYGYWVIWNHDGNDSFLCIEPQTCAINAPNLSGDQDHFGFRMLAPGEVFTAASRILLS